MRIAASPYDPIVVLFTALVVGFATLFILSTAPDARERTLRLLFFYLAYCTLEILVKRGAHYAWYLYLIKFGLLFLVFGSWIASRGHDRSNLTGAPMRGLLGVFLGLAALQIFNPYQFNPIVGVLGWLSDFIFALFYFIAFDAFGDVTRVRRWMRMTAFLAVLSAVACFAEQWWGPDVLYKDYPTYVRLSYFSPEGIRIRPSSLAPFMEVFGIGAMLGLIAARQGRVWLLVAGITACTVANALHVVRISWVVGFAIVALMLVMNRQRRFLNMALAVVAVVLAVQIATQVSEGLIEGSFASMTTPVDTFTKTRLWGLRALPTIVLDYPLGVGVGSASPGLRLVDTTGVTTFGTHNYLTELAAQMSVFGPLLLLLFSAGVLGKSTAAALRAAPGERQAYLSVGVGIFGALTASFFAGGALGSFPTSDYFWLAAGAMMRLAVMREPATASAVAARFRTPLPVFRPASIRPR